MLHSIGTKRHARGDLVDVLSECHSRIRAFIDMAIAVGERTHAPSIEIAEAASRVERYFVEALPLHVRDEEESILPRLRGRSATLDAALAQMHDQHELHAALIARLCVAAGAVRVAPSHPDYRRTLIGVARPLAALFDAHLAAEEAVVFPAVRQMLPVAEQEKVLEELRARRDRNHRER